MKVAVLGLGMEGKNAVKALLDYGHQVYASDLNENIVINEFGNANLEFDLGFHDYGKINSADAVVVSPSLWGKKIAKEIISDHKMLSDILTAHKSVLTIGVTGTNGKTTTCYMLRDILEKSGLKVLLGGNAGGGFEGYTKVILEASKREYDIILVEVCDMTLDFASHVFDFDMVLVTNMGSDHMDHHLTLENYRKSVCKFLNGKKQAFLNENDILLKSCADCANETFFFGPYTGKLKLFGVFNRDNASGASKVAEILKIPTKLIEDVLSNFIIVEGRTTTISYKGAQIIIGKTDNPDAAAAVFSEAHMDVIMVGTPRKGEICRYNILKEVSNANPSLVVLFPGLDNTTNNALKILRDEGYEGEVCIVTKVTDIVDLTVKCTAKYKNIFIGGNGQKKIMCLQKALFELSNCNNNHRRS
ncbi:Mur ligase family protein [Methanobacterium spitsbergense]|uniref:UDP-N-acetylmuramoyl-L-alanine--D-glutamate ligase n=1 Tax=Methanobacterium spitsbergense TaxID=2874285 RepID=A0A8T5UTM3_9EURY|nr:Mur ligase family protein [Methanobacterium spitsbergense]MBZ2165547.1 UDP-N-acetylmuramoyl-L-alanine--D-glutamate ligase [Methanobacterium spitsbergense]